MKTRVPILVLVAALAGFGLLFSPKHRHEGATSTALVARASNQSAIASNNSGISDAATSENIRDLRKLLVDDYHSTNEVDGKLDSITSLLAHQLIAERLKTNDAFLKWATNAATSVIARFMLQGSSPIYGSRGFKVDALHFYKVTVSALTGFEAKADYDPNPSNEGPLDFMLEGGIRPTLLRVQNGYRMEGYQIDPESWKRAPRNIGRMDWSFSVAPLDKNQVDTLARRAFHEMTGLDLSDFNAEAKIRTPEILNPEAVHSDVKVTGNINARLFSKPKDYVYPFAIFQYDKLDPALVFFSGEMVQTSAAHGEFVSLFAGVRKTEAIFELGEKFLGQGTWEQEFITKVRAMNTEERGQVYRRVFQH